MPDWVVVAYVVMAVILVALMMYAAGREVYCSEALIGFLPLAVIWPLTLALGVVALPFIALYHLGRRHRVRDMR
jgi:hypothetical protein